MPSASHRNADQPRAGALEHAADSQIHRIFDQHRRALADGPLQQIESLLASAGDQDVVRLARHAFRSRLFQQIAAQRRIAGRRPKLQDGRGVVARDHFGAGLAKLFERKQQFRRPRARKTGGCGNVIGGSGAARHEASPPHMSGDQAFRFEQRIGCGNRSPIQSKLTSQFASGWQAGCLWAMCPTQSSLSSAHGVDGKEGTYRQDSMD